MLSLVRLDDRLLHGQVVVGWGQALGVQRFVLVDDRVRESAWERDLYTMGMPPGVELQFASVAEAAAAVDGWMRSSHRVLLVAAEVDALARLCEQAPQIRKVNIGGLHQGAGRRERLRYVFLSEHEASRLQALSARGVEVTAQDVPTATPVRLGDLL